MSITCKCPHCGKSVTLRERPISACPACSTDFADDLKEELNTEFKIERPALLSITRYFCMTIGLLVFSGIGLHLFTYSTHGIERFGIIELLLIGNFGAFFMLIANGLKRNKPWTRPLLIFAASLPLLSELINLYAMPVFDTPPGYKIGLIIPVFMAGSIPVGIACAYLLLKKSVSLYYKETKFEPVVIANT